MAKLKDETGNRYGRLVVVEQAERKVKGFAIHWLCKCDCGGSSVVAGTDLRRGNSTSCGCGKYDGVRAKAKERSEESVEDRFHSKCSMTETDECIEWQGSLNSDGYGVIGKTSNRGKILAHRLSHELYIGPIPEDMVVMHSCDNPCCVNPKHLSYGTNQDNTQDRVNKNRCARGERMGMTHLTEDKVLRIFKDPSRQVDIAKKYGISQQTVSAIKTRKTWAHVTS